MVGYGAFFPKPALRLLVTLLLWPVSCAAIAQSAPANVIERAELITMVHESGAFSVELPRRCTLVRHVNSTQIHASCTLSLGPADHLSSDIASIISIDFQVYRLEGTTTLSASDQASLRIGREELAPHAAKEACDGLASWIGQVRRTASPPTTQSIIEQRSLELGSPIAAFRRHLKCEFQGVSELSVFGITTGYMFFDEGLVAKFEGRAPYRLYAEHKQLFDSIATSLKLLDKAKIK